MGYPAAFCSQATHSLFSPGEVVNHNEIPGYHLGTPQHLLMPEEISLEKGGSEITLEVHVASLLVRRGVAVQRNEFTRSKA